MGASSSTSSPDQSSKPVKVDEEGESENIPTDTKETEEQVTTAVAAESSVVSIASAEINDGSNETESQSEDNTGAKAKDNTGAKANTLKDIVKSVPSDSNSGQDNRGGSQNPTQKVPLTPSKLILPELKNNSERDDTYVVAQLSHMTKDSSETTTLKSNTDEGLRSLSQTEIENLILQEHDSQRSKRLYSVSMKSVNSRHNIAGSEFVVASKMINRDPNEWNINLSKKIEGFDMDKFQAANKRQVPNHERRAGRFQSISSGDSSALLNIHSYSADDEKLMLNIEQTAI